MIFVASPVISTKSKLSVLIDGVALEPNADTRGVIRALVSVRVAARSVAFDVLSTLFSDNVVFTCAGVREAHADETDTRKLSVVAVNPAMVVRSESIGWNSPFRFTTVEPSAE